MLHPYIIVDVDAPWFDKFLRLATKEHKSSLQNNVDYDDAGATTTMNVTIDANDNAATNAIVDNDVDASTAIVVTITQQYR